MAVKFMRCVRPLEEQRALYTRRWQEQIQGTPNERLIPLELYLRRNASKPGVYWLPIEEGAQ